MENQTSKIVFFKSRSLAGRLSAAFDFIEKNLKILVKLSSFILVPMAALISFCYIFFGNLAVQIKDVKSFTPELYKYLIGLAIILVICLVGAIFFKGLLYTLVKEYLLRDSIARISFKEIKKNFLHNTKRFFFINLAIAVLVLLYYAIILGLMFLSKWTLVLTFPFFIFIIIPFIYSEQIYMFEDIKLLKAVKKGFQMGAPNWGGTFILLILAEIFALIIQGIAFIPFGIGSLVQSLSFTSMLDGNPSTLPVYFSILMFVLSMVGYFIAYLAQMLPSVSMMFQYFSATKKQAEKEEENNQSL